MPKKTNPVADAAGKKPRLRLAQRAAAADWRPAYLAALAQTGVYDRAADAAGVNHATAWKERQRNPEFAAKVKEAVSTATALLEDEAVRRAIHGMRRYKFSKGGEPIMDPRTGEQYFELEYSDTMLAILLKARLPETYREKVGLEHSGEVTHKHLTLVEFEERMRRAEL